MTESLQHKHDTKCHQEMCESNLIIVRITTVLISGSDCVFFKAVYLLVYGFTMIAVRQHEHHAGHLVCMLER